MVTNGSSVNVKIVIASVSSALLTAFAVVTFMFSIGDRFYAAKADVEALKSLNSKLVEQNTLILQKQEIILTNQGFILNNQQKTLHALKAE
jgi:hypothetical protein